MGLGTGSDICSHTSGSLAATAFCRQLNSHCCIPAGGASDLEAPIVSSRQTRTIVFLCFFPAHSFHSIVQMMMIHLWGNIYSRCRFLLCEWRFRFLHLRRDRAQPWQHLLPVKVSPMWLHQLPLFLSLKTHLSASTHFSAAPFKQSSVLNHLYSELYLDTLDHFHWHIFPQDCSKYVQITPITVCSRSEGEITVRWVMIYFLLLGEMLSGWRKLACQVDVFVQLSAADECRLLPLSVVSCSCSCLLSDFSQQSI